MIVDISDKVGDWDVITPDMITSANVKVEKGDILILHTGYHRYYEGRREQDLVRYFCLHPGGAKELVDWMLDMKMLPGHCSSFDDALTPLTYGFTRNHSVGW